MQTTDQHIQINLPPFMVPAMTTMDDAAIRAELHRVLKEGLAPYVEGGVVSKEVYDAYLAALLPSAADIEIARLRAEIAERKAASAA